VRLGLLKEGEEPGRLLQIFRHDVPQCGGSRWGLRVFVLCLHASSGSAIGGCCRSVGRDCRSANRTPAIGVPPFCEGAAYHKS
jgi:hypothetical protein